MTKKPLSILILVLLGIIAFFGRANLPAVYGSNGNQTIPTRTPIPPPATATSSGGGGNNGGNNNPTPTNTPVTSSGVTPTSTLIPVNIAPTPVGGFLPTAVPCDANPTIQTLDATNVRSGPGTEYDVIGEMVFLEVRYIVGRAESAEWWLIQFNDGQLGWVADAVVTVQGYTAIVPIVAAPPLNGGTVPTGPAWNPTPPPSCTVTPPPTESPTAVPTEPPAEVAEAAATVTLPPTDPPATEVRPTDTPIAQATIGSLPPTPVPAATAIPDNAGGSSSGLGLMVLGAAIILGVGIFLFIRQQRG